MNAQLVGYFAAVVLLVYFYIVLLIFLAKTLIFIYRESKQWVMQKLKRIKPDRIRKVYQRNVYVQLVKQNPFFLQSKKSRLYLTLFVLGNILAWQNYRYTDVVSNDFKHKEAREYYALSHLLLSYDMGLVVIFRNPDSVLLQPLNTLQDALIKSAQAYLPNNDGEIAMYRYFFKLYPYMATHYEPWPGDAKKVTDLTHQVLKEFSKLSIEDAEVREYSRYRLYPMAAEYYLFIQWEEYKTVGKSMIEREYNEYVRTSLYNDSMKVQQLEDIGRWSKMHYEALKNYPKIQQFIKENPLIDAMYLADITLPLRGVLESKIFHLTFRCDDALLPVVHHYTNLFNRRHYAKTDKRYWGYRNAISGQSRPFSNASCALCGYEPIKGTYVFDDKKDACFPKDRDSGYTQEYWDADPKTHYKWLYRVRELEKIIHDEI